VKGANPVGAAAVRAEGVDRRVAPADQVAAVVNRAVAVVVVVGPVGLAVARAGVVAVVVEAVPAVRGVVMAVAGRAVAAVRKAGRAAVGAVSAAVKAEVAETVSLSAERSNH
jgi:hypothetical protein